MIIYIAGPMTGKPNLNYPAFFRAEETLVQHDFSVLNPAKIDHQYPTQCAVLEWSGIMRLCKACPECNERTWQWYMRKAVAMLAEADGVGLLDGWSESRGARAEVALADALEMPARPWYDWVRFKNQETIFLEVPHGG